MNDFTKDELQELHKAYSHYYDHVYEGDINPPMIIFDKLQSMIENYCESTHVYDPGMPENCSRCCNEVLE